ncbi:ABC transporter permease [Paracoccus homiensis]|uniref:ABC transporter permease n=1 Tax=Paracoccus homiensis TaxID=364199 RepID=UPI00398CADDB
MTHSPPLPQSRKPRQVQKLRSVHRQRRFASLRAIGALILREMTTANGRSANGYLWAVAEPVGGIVLLTVIFSLGFRSPPVGTNFAIFYASGLVPFMFYQTLSNKVARAIQYSKSLLAYPAVTFMDALLARTLYETVTQILVAYLIFAGIYFSMETRTDPQILEIMLSLAMALVFSLGVGVMNCFLFSAFDWWSSAWSILTRPLFIMSCLHLLHLRRYPAAVSGLPVVQPAGPYHRPDAQGVLSVLCRRLCQPALCLRGRGGADRDRAGIPDPLSPRSGQQLRSDPARFAVRGRAS